MILGTTNTVDNAGDGSSVRSNHVQHCAQNETEAAGMAACSRKYLPSSYVIIATSCTPPWASTSSKWHFYFDAL
eukprot:3168373-Amphidinium_carterae.1